MSDYQTQQKELIGKIKKDLAKKQVKATIVILQDSRKHKTNAKDFENDDRICLTSLAFIDKDTFQLISEKIIKPLKEIEPEFFYQKLESTHLTIKNVRIINKPPNFTEDDVRKADQLFKIIVPQFPKIDFDLQGLLVLPTSISLLGYCNTTYGDLLLALDQGLKQVDLRDDKKYFSNSVFVGAINLCRFTHHPSKEFLTKVNELENVKIGKMTVNKINLVTCNAACNPKTRKIIGNYRMK